MRLQPSEEVQQGTTLSCFDTVSTKRELNAHTHFYKWEEEMYSVSRAVQVRVAIDNETMTRETELRKLASGFYI